MQISTALSRSFTEFTNSGKAGGVLLILCTLASLTIVNSPFGKQYLEFWHMTVAGLSVELWVNDALIAVFFLLVGLELERELYCGELSDLRRAVLPALAAVGGIALPSLIHFSLNHGTDFQPGLGIPMATDIAFALGVLALLGSRVPASLKVFLAALAVMDDLGAIVVIALFYTSTVSATYLASALAVFSALIFINRKLNVKALSPYLIGGAVMWFLMLKSGVHATIAGVLLAFAIPFSKAQDDETSPSHRLEHFLHKPVAFMILPIFALANTGIVFDQNWHQHLLSMNSVGIMLGLAAGKPIGITLACAVAVSIGLCKLPDDLTWSHIVGVSMLGGIGFTMSIFITNLAFPAAPEIVNAAKLAVLAASLISGIAGYVWLIKARSAR
jgi:NhaA family Na+:H+ antiporter